MDRFSQLQLCGLLFAILFISQGTLFGTTRIYQADIERAIFNILNIELPKVNHMGGKQLLVLRNILTLLNYLNPLNKDKRLGLNKLPLRLVDIVSPYASSKCACHGST